MGIALIEDRIGRLEKFTVLNIYENRLIKVIARSEFDSLVVSLEENNTNILDGFDCIAVHRSALNNELRDILKNYCKQFQISLIFFSGGISSNVYKDFDFPFLHINAKDFYSYNLTLLIEDYEKTGKINLLILQFGLKWKMSLLLSLRNNIIVSQNKKLIQNQFLNSNISDRELIKRARDLHINSLIRPDLLNEKTHDILNADDFSVISSDQLHEIKTAIDHLLIDLI
jgi:hypothetical protein